MAALLAYFARDESGFERLTGATTLPVSDSRPATTASANQSDFDFYVLALSWSPSYCASKGGDADPQQCSVSRPFGFTVHGLWPQYERGSPQDCAIGEGQSIDRDILRDIKPVLPSSGLARHEWRKHGTCSGLSQRAYFDTMLQAVRLVRIPDPFKQVSSSIGIAPSRVETAFLQANPGMNAKGFAAICDRRYLTEVRICLTKDLKFRECNEVDQNACRANSVEMPPAR